MRFIVDENLSPRLCQFLTATEDTAEHVRDAVGAGASDAVVLDHARESGAVIVTADTDFGTLVARAGARQPSIILMRELLTLSVDGQGRLLTANLDQIRGALADGAIVVLAQDAIRIRPLPIAPRSGREGARKGHDDPVHPS